MTLYYYRPRSETREIDNFEFVAIAVIEVILLWNLAFQRKNNRSFHFTLELSSSEDFWFFSFGFILDAPWRRIKVVYF